MNRQNRRQRYSYYQAQRTNNGQVSATHQGEDAGAIAQELAQPELMAQEVNNQDNPTCHVRFFNAAAGYGELKVEAAGKVVDSNLSFGTVSEFTDIPEGYQNITIQMVTNPNAVLINKDFPFSGCMNSTAAIINTSSGIDLIVFNDAVCQPAEGRACFRVANLSYTSPPLDILVENGEAVFNDVRFKQMTEFKQADAGEYNFDVLISREVPEAKQNDVSVITPEAPVDEGGYPAETEPAYTYFYEEFEAGKKYTAYIIGNKNYDPQLRIETIEEEI